jgi:hypothetical protein
VCGSCWTPEAIRGAARAWRPARDQIEYFGASDFDGASAMEAALIAAEPFLREALAREVEAMVHPVSGNPASRHDIAARLRAGVPAPEPTKGNTDG